MKTFKLTACIAGLVAGMTLPSFAQTLTIHPRVGIELDQQEREYFNILPQWPSGIILARAGEYDSVVFFLRDSTSTQQVISGETFETLGTYIDRHEDFETLRYSIDTRLLQNISEYRLRYIPGTPVSFVLRSGERVTARPLHVSTSSLVIYDDSEPYQWQLTDEKLGRLELTDIARIESKRSRFAIPTRLTLSFVASAGMAIFDRPSIHLYDAPWIAATAWNMVTGLKLARSPIRTAISDGSSVRDEARAMLVRMQEFRRDFLPPEIPMDSDDLRSLYGAVESTGIPTWEPARTLEVSSHLLVSPLGMDGFVASGFGLNDPDRRNVPWLKVNLGQDLGERTSIGSELQVALNGDHEGDRYSIHGQILTFYMDRYLSRPNMLTFAHRWSMSFGAGLSLIHLRTSQDVEWSPQIIGLDPDLGENPAVGGTKWTAALQARVAAAYLVDARTSIRISLSSWLPPLSTEKVDRNAGSNTIYRLEPVTLVAGIGLGVVHRLGR